MGCREWPFTAQDKRPHLCVLGERARKQPHESGKPSLPISRRSKPSYFTFFFHILTCTSRLGASHGIPCQPNLKMGSFMGNTRLRRNTGPQVRKCYPYHCLELVPVPLTDVSVRLARARNRAYKLSDGAGLCLLVQPSGKKWWRFRYKWEG